MTHSIFLLSDEIPLYLELYEYFVKQWNSIANTYKSAGLSASNALTVMLLIVGLFLGGIIATYSIAISKRKYGKFVRRLLHADATSIEKALTITDLQLSKSKRLKRGIQRSTELRRVLSCVEEDRFYSEAESEATSTPNTKKISSGVKFWNWLIGNDGQPKFCWKEQIDSCHFYIKEKNTYLASTRYDKKGESLLIPVIATVVFTFLMIELLKWMPTILSAAVGVFA